MPMTYAECDQMARENESAGPAVEGAQIEAWGRAYRPGALASLVASVAGLVKQGKYTPETAWTHWYPLANKLELGYSSRGEQPNRRHSIGREGRLMAAYYMEARWRREAFRLAGVPMPAELEAGCDKE